MIEKPAEEETSFHILLKSVTDIVKVQAYIVNFG